MCNREREGLKWKHEMSKANEKRRQPWKLREKKDRFERTEDGLGKQGK
jgi:hypothetical protein